MRFNVRHSLPGRMRVGYDKNRLTPRQAALAANLLSLQDGFVSVSVNSLSGSFLIFYQTERQTEDSVLSFLQVLDQKYLEDPKLLEAVEEPERQIGLPEALFFMTVLHYSRRLLPPFMRRMIRIRSIAPRIFKGAASVFRGHISCTEVLDASALLAAVVSGQGTTADNISFLLNVGETIEDFTRRKSYANLTETLLSEEIPVRLCSGDEEKQIPFRMLSPGDTIVVRTGDMIPADGDILRGEALINQAALTGEPLADEKRKGQSVYAGTIIQEGELHIRVRAVGSNTRIRGILNQLESSQQLKISSQIRSEQLADRLVRYNFLLAFLIWAVTRNTTKAVSALMVDYSCAMKLAAPIAVLTAMKEAAGKGISVKGGKFLEEAAKADAVVFDKTGTLTNAAPVLSRVIAFDGRSKSEILRTAACLEEHFVHPVARAVVDAAMREGLVHPENHAKVEYIVAHGIASRLNGKRILIGSAHFVFEDEKIQKPSEWKEIYNSAVGNGESLLYLAEEASLIGIFAVRDTVRPEAAPTLSVLRRQGVRYLGMITGDDEGAARTVAVEAGLDSWISRALPEDKTAEIRRLRDKGYKVMMVGDGINDAPALSAADIGVAMGNAAAVAGDTADIVLSEKGNLTDLPKIIETGRLLLKRIDENNRGIIAVNSALILAGLFGALGASAAAVLHNSATVFFCARAAKPFTGREK